MDTDREPIDEATMRRLMEVQRVTAEQRQVQAAWGRIEAWLGEHAPGSLAALRPSPRADEVQALARRIGVRLSDEAEEGAVPHWRVSWVPFCAADRHEVHPLLYVDLETGRVCFWSKYGDREPRYESVTDYLEEMADRLESPHLLGGLEPGTQDMRVLVWNSPEPGTDTHDGGPGPA